MIVEGSGRDALRCRPTEWDEGLKTRFECGWPADWHQSDGSRGIWNIYPQPEGTRPIIQLPSI